MAGTPSKIVGIEQSPQPVFRPELGPLVEAVLQHLLKQPNAYIAPVGTCYVRTKAAAQYLTMDAATLADWRSQPGKGPRYRKVCGRVIYSLADLDAWLEQHPLQGGARQ